MEITKNYFLESDINAIVRILEDLELYAKAHPLIQQAEKLKSSSLESNYKITEKPFRWVPLKVRYKATVRSNNHEVVYKITEIPLTQSVIHYKLYQESNKKVKVQFHLKIISKLIGKKLLLNKMIAAQDRTKMSIQLDLNK